MSTTIAQLVCYGLGIEFLLLVILDLWLGYTGRQMITDAARDDNAASGWIEADFVGDGSSSVVSSTTQP